MQQLSFIISYMVYFFKPKAHFFAPPRDVMSIYPLCNNDIMYIYL